HTFNFRARVLRVVHMILLHEYPVLEYALLKSTQFGCVDFAATIVQNFLRSHNGEFNLKTRNRVSYETGESGQQTSPVQTSIDPGEKRGACSAHVSASVGLRCYPDHTSGMPQSPFGFSQSLTVWDDGSVGRTGYGPQRNGSMDYPRFSLKSVTTVMKMLVSEDQKERKYRRSQNNSLLRTHAQYRPCVNIGHCSQNTKFIVAVLAPRSATIKLLQKAKNDFCDVSTGLTDADIMSSISAQPPSCLPCHDETLKASYFKRHAPALSAQLYRTKSCEHQ
ncbi:hypothetical protein PM082_021394, partial [Marasmius tenuissimus]